MTEAAQLQSAGKRRAGQAAGVAGLAFCVVCWVVFWVFTPAIFAALLVGLPTAAAAYAVGHDRLAFAWLVAAIAPAATLALT